MKNKMFSMLALLMAATTGAWAQEPEYIDLTTTDYKTWTLDEMPAYAVGLIVEYETELELANAGNNTAKLGEWDEYEANVTLTGRTLYKDGEWNTLCLPFSLGNPEAEEGHYFDGTLLEGATVKTLESTDFEDGVLTINFEDATMVVAGQPYIVKWEDNGGSNLVNPVFENVVIGTTTTANVETKYVDFVGTYSSVVFDAGAAHKDVLFLGGGSTLYYPDGTKATTINACRAYFQLKGITAGDPASGGNVKGFVLNFDGEDVIDGIIAIDNGQLTIDNEGSWYDIGGRKLDGKPTQRGIYIHNGKKVLY